MTKKSKNTKFKTKCSVRPKKLSYKFTENKDETNPTDKSPSKGISKID